MKKALLLVLFLSACFSIPENKRCDASFVASCTGDALTACVEGFVITQTCGTGTVCDETFAECRVIGVLSCGDGTVTPPEECDEAANNALEGSCLPTCERAGCGDGVRQQSLQEQCDDSNTQSGDGCSSVCRFEICGNGTVDQGEACDDNNTNNGDACEADCQLPFCGNGILDQGEQCDDANTAAEDGCSSGCLFEIPPQCGDGIVNAGEICDDGNIQNGDGCRLDCLGLEFCGDNILDINEVCDDGNNSNNDNCNSNCLSDETCGNNFIDLTEACDDGNNINGDECEFNCTLPSCNNDIVDINELCYPISPLSINVSDFPGALSIGDIDNDGDEDIVFSGGGSIGVLSNQNGSFIFSNVIITGVSAESIELIDLDEDQDLDLVLATNDARVFLNTSNGQFTFNKFLPLSSQNPKTILTTDLNGDGRNDVIVSNNLNSTNVFLNQGNLQFGEAPFIGTSGIPVLGNFNSDIFPDLAFTNINNDSITVFMNNGSAVFSGQQFLSTGDSPVNSDSGDFNNDNIDDIVSVNATTPFQLNTNVSILNSNPGLTNTFAFTVIGGNTLTKSADLNNDDFFDIIGTNSSGGISININNKQSLFIQETGLGTGQGQINSIKIKDINNDNALDIISSHPLVDRITIFKATP